MKTQAWQTHYTRSKSLLSVPDENLVRLLNKQTSFSDKSVVLDLGCGSGRHMSYLKQMGISHIIGMDLSFNALSMCQKIGFSKLVQNINTSLPLADNTIDAIIAWGSLHYGPKKDLPVMLREIKRTLKPGGHFFATLRSDYDTYLKKGKHLGNNEWITDLDDIAGSFVSFYSEDELKQHLSLFAASSYGIMERSIIGNIKSRISHWIISCAASSE